METVQKVLAPKEEMRIFGRGIRRRLAPMLGNSRKLRMAYSLLFSMPGSPMICYGDEIGMGEDLSRDGRNSVRTPMQWTDGRNGGFSSVAKSRVTQPAVERGRYSFKNVNVEAQEKDEDSLLALVKTLAKLRRNHTSVGEHDCQLLHCSSDRVLAHAYQGPGHEIVMLHNLSGRREKVSVELDAASPSAPKLLLGEAVEPPVESHIRTELGPYGFCWLKWDR